MLLNLVVTMATGMWLRKEELDAESQGCTTTGRPVALTSPYVTLTASQRDGHSLPILQVTERKLVAFPRPLSFSGVCLPAEPLPPGVLGSTVPHSPHGSARRASPRGLARVK